MHDSFPKMTADFLEKYTRSFNYPEQSCLKTEKDVETRGIKTYFCSMSVLLMITGSTMRSADFRNMLFLMKI